ncbi:MAG TPA: TetR/AcrR family transcriptional regulator [Patescibacteria group bacterium]|nr:TetR/AcrR family transcriptional regulator [Patescibacteria group bacterium]
MDVRDGHRKRLPREEREKLILEEAVRFFAEAGFEGQTRALAERLGVTQPLLYRYFPDKETLIDRVFDEVYLKRWRPEWEALLRDRQRPLTDRLIDFYQAYCAAIFKPEWVRIFMFAGLKGDKINNRYLELVHQNILEPLCAEIRAEAGVPSPIDLPLDDIEIGLAWAMHGSIFHIAVRKWIYKLPMSDDIDGLIDATVRAFMQGCGESMKRVTGLRLQVAG